jgi:hypothetical protein
MQNLVGFLMYFPNETGRFSLEKRAAKPRDVFSSDQKDRMVYEAFQGRQHP